VREHLIEEIRPVRSLLSALVVLPWQATPDHSVLAALVVFLSFRHFLPFNMALLLSLCHGGPAA
jgi:hypothetical protein